MKHFTPKRLSIALLACAITSPATADTATDINAANALVREGKYDEALDSYQSITPNDAIKADLDYNRAVAQYRKGDIESAKAMFTEAATSSDRKLAAAARYNLGNCFYADAVAAAEKDKPAAIDSLGQAIQHYRGSLAGNPNPVDARANIELAAELLNQLKQEQEQQQQQQQQQQQEPPGSEDQPSKQEQSQGENGQPQESNDQSGKDVQPKPDQSKRENPNQNPSGDQQQPQQQPSGEQPQASESDREQQAEANDQPVPSGELKAASQQETNEEPNDRVAIVDPNAKDGLMSKEEALKMLQAVRDRDMLRRLRHEQIERNMHVPTDKDW